MHSIIVTELEITKGKGFCSFIQLKDFVVLFCTGMPVGNTLFKKRAIDLVTHEYGPSKTQVVYGAE